MNELDPNNEDVPGDEPQDTAPAAHAEPLEPGYAVRAWVQALAVTALTSAVVTYAFRFEARGAKTMLPPLGLAYLVMLAGALLFARSRGDLKEQFAPRRLDLTMGAAVAAVLYLVCNFVPIVVLQGRPQEGWLWRLYLQLGEPREVAAPYVGIAVLAIAGLEEIAWRGWVMRALRVAHGRRVALFASTALYALAHVGTMFTLRDADAGLNPLLVASALGCGLVWGTMALRFERLGPSIFAHALLSWAVALFPMWKRL